MELPSDAVDPESRFMEHFGISLSEILAAQNATFERFNKSPNRIAAELFDRMAPPTSEFVRDRFVSSLFPVLSPAGACVLTINAREQIASSPPLREWRKRMLSDPVHFSDLSLWCLLLAAHDASCAMQMDHCGQPTSESHLTGMLLRALGEGCERWRATVQKPLARKGLSLRLHSLDLTIGGGEQATGGDFGLVLELAGPPTRIVPLTFQAKRYLRPKADVSQKHAARGYQLTQLGQQQCASAYIFYENGNAAIPTPLPPLIKRVEDVKTPTKTEVTSKSVDLPTHFLSVLSGAGVPTASSAEEALQMIFARAEPGQLSQLAVIASDEMAFVRYTSALDELERLRRIDGTDDPIIQRFD